MAAGEDLPGEGAVRVAVEVDGSDTEGLDDSRQLPALGTGAVRRTRPQLDAVEVLRRSDRRTRAGDEHGREQGPANTRQCAARVAAMSAGAAGHLGVVANLLDRGLARLRLLRRALGAAVL